MREKVRECDCSQERKKEFSERERDFVLRNDCKMLAAVKKDHFVLWERERERESVLRYNETMKTNGNWVRRKMISSSHPRLMEKLKIAFVNQHQRQHNISSRRSIMRIISSMSAGISVTRWATFVRKFVSKTFLNGWEHCPYRALPLKVLVRKTCHLVS